MSAEQLNWNLYYNLSQKCHIIHYQDSNTIKLTLEQENGKNYAVGFTISIQAYSQSEAVEKADRQAKMLADLISIRSGSHTLANLSAYYSTSESRRITVIMQDPAADSEIGITLDFRHAETASLVKANGRINQRYHHAASGIRDMSLGLYESAITHFFQVIEQDSSSQDKIKYKPLRHALSHMGALELPTKQSLEKEFGKDYFALTKEGAFDHTSRSNKFKLKKEAKAMMEIILANLKND